MSEGMEATAGKTRRRVAMKPVTEAVAKKVKVTLHISREADIRLNIHCTMMDLDRSAMIEKLINEQLRRWVVSDRGGQEITGGEAVA